MSHFRDIGHGQMILDSRILYILTMLISDNNNGQNVCDFVLVINSNISLLNHLQHMALLMPNCQCCHFLKNIE